METRKLTLPHNHSSTTAELLETLPSPEAFETSAFLFSLTSDETRLRILYLLCHSEECVANIAAYMDMTSPAVSHHLRILKNASIIRSKKLGKEVYYTLADNEKATLMHSIIDATFNITHN
ncbi:MAG: metalloregulator ArsR/SmtB family transcription factor [Anaerovoracaceae bacterium]